MSFFESYVCARIYQFLVFEYSPFALTDRWGVQVTFGFKAGASLLLKARPHARSTEAPAPATLPLTGRRCGAQGRHGCGAEVDAYGDHCLACPRTGLLPRRGFVVERAWVQVARKAVGPAASGSKSWYGTTADLHEGAHSPCSLSLSLRPPNALVTSTGTLANDRSVGIILSQHSGLVHIDE